MCASLIIILLLASIVTGNEMFVIASLLFGIWAVSRKERNNRDDRS